MEFDINEWVSTSFHTYDCRHYVQTNFLLFSYSLDWFLFFIDTVTVVPFFTQYIIKYITLLYFTSIEFWKDKSEYLDLLHHLFWKVWSLLLSFAFVERVVQSVSTISNMIPSGIWKALPFTILTLGQTSVLLPWALFHVENIFRRAAHRNAAKTT